MSLQPLPQAIITASKLRQQAKELILMAEELEASVPRPVVTRSSSSARGILGDIQKRNLNEPRQRGRRK
jgi:hypothetical protein